MKRASTFSIPESIRRKNCCEFATNIWRTSLRNMRTMKQRLNFWRKLQISPRRPATADLQHRDTEKSNIKAIADAEERRPSATGHRNAALSFLALSESQNQEQRQKQRQKHIHRRGRGGMKHQGRIYSESLGRE